LEENPRAPDRGTRGESPSPLMKINVASSRAFWRHAPAHQGHWSRCACRRLRGGNTGQTKDRLRAGGLVWRPGKPVLPCIKNSEQRRRFHCASATTDVCNQARARALIRTSQHSEKSSGGTLRGLLGQAALPFIVSHAWDAGRWARVRGDGGPLLLRTSRRTPT
jgi:hypothetical protein